jgi:hypothetical protein
MDFEEHNAKLLSREFLAIVLAGFGDEWVWIISFPNLLCDHAVQAPSPNQ